MREAGEVCNANRPGPVILDAELLADDGVNEVIRLTGKAVTRLLMVTSLPLSNLALAIGSTG